MAGPTDHAGVVGLFDPGLEPAEAGGEEDRGVSAGAPVAGNIELTNLLEVATIDGDVAVVGPDDLVGQAEAAAEPKAGPFAGGGTASGIKDGGETGGEDGELIDLNADVISDIEGDDLETAGVDPAPLVVVAKVLSHGEHVADAE